MSNNAMPLPLPGSRGLRITRSADISIFPAAFFGTLSRSVMTRLRLLAGSTAKYSFPMICSYGGGSERPAARDLATRGDLHARYFGADKRRNEHGCHEGGQGRVSNASIHVCLAFAKCSGLCAHAARKSTGAQADLKARLYGVRREPRVDQLRVTFAESPQRFDRKAPVGIGAAEAPWPGAGVAGSQCPLETLVEWRGRAELSEDDVAPDVERARGGHERINIPVSESGYACSWSTSSPNPSSSQAHRLSARAAARVTIAGVLRGQAR